MKLKDYKPKKLPYKTPEQAAIYLCCKWHFKKENFIKKFNLIEKWPCVKCIGKGYIQEYTGVGNDSFDKDCYDCINTGIISQKEFMLWYAVEISNYNKRFNGYLEITKMIKGIKRKLTRKEYEFITKFD